MVKVTWLGHSAFLVEIDGYNILIDPWITNPKAPSKIPDLKNTDLIIVTHGHEDHIGDTLDIMKKSKAKLIAIYDLANELVRRGAPEDRVIGANIGGPVITGLGELRIALTPATHSSPVGSPTGVVVIGRNKRVYHAGDTGVTMDMKLVGEIYKPDIALLPIGGHFTMDPIEAAYAVKLIQPRVAIPMHYGTFPVLYGDPKVFEEEVRKLSINTKVVILNPGDTYSE